MDSELRAILTSCIARLENGASIDHCVGQYPHVGDELRAHLEQWTAMAGHALSTPPTPEFTEGRHRMLAALASSPAAPLASMRSSPAWAKATVVAAAALVLFAGSAGASAKLGGPDVSSPVFQAVGVSSNGTNGGGNDGQESGIGHSSASDRGLECANPNAFEGRDNREDKAQNSEDAKQKVSCSRGSPAEDNQSENGPAETAAPDGEDGSGCKNNGNGPSENSNPNACEGQGNSDDGINNASENAENGREGASDNAFEGSGNRTGGNNDANSDEANGTGPDNDNKPD